MKLFMVSFLKKKTAKKLKSRPQSKALYYIESGLFLNIFLKINCRVSMLQLCTAYFREDDIS